MTIDHKVSINGRDYPVKKVETFFSIYADSLMKGTATQLRTLAYKGRDLIVDKLLAGKTHGEKAKVFRYGDHEKEPPYDRITDEHEPDQKNVKILPPRKDKAATENYLPFKHQKLKEGYLRRKITKELDPRILVATGDYVKGIVIRKIKRKDAGVGYKVTLAKRKHRPSGLPLWKLAALHEFGTSGFRIFLFGDRSRPMSIRIPARPHWRPVYEMLKKAMAKLPEDLRADALKEALRKLR